MCCHPFSLHAEGGEVGRVLSRSLEQVGNTCAKRNFLIPIANKARHPPRLLARTINEKSPGTQIEHRGLRG